jgi:glycosyltransferase involved in cell wall biosynthesis
LLGADPSTAAIQSYKAWLRKTAPDLVCVSNGGISDGLNWMLACSDERIPYLVVAQSNGEHFWPDDLIASRLAEAYAGARACFFVSRRNLELLEEQISIRLPAAQIIRNPVNVDYDAAPPWPNNRETWRLACVARIEPAAKGQDILIKALSLPKWRERPLCITFYGEGPFERSIRNLSDGLASIELAGHVSDVEGIWAKNHALVLASRYEGLPLALVEAMLCSRMAIVTDVAGNTEVIEPGITGFVAKAPTVSLMDEALEEAWSRREEWREMGKRAGNAIRKLTSADPVEDFCDQLLAEAGTTAA